MNATQTTKKEIPNSLKEAVPFLRNIAKNNYHEYNTSKVLDNIGLTKEIMANMGNGAAPKGFLNRKDIKCLNYDKSMADIRELAGSGKPENLGKAIVLAHAVAQKMHDEQPEGKKDLHALTEPANEKYGMFYKLRDVIQHVTMVISLAAFNLGKLSGDQGPKIPSGGTNIGF